MAQGNATLGGFPEKFGVGMFGEFIKANIPAINGHGLGIGGKGNDAGAVIEFDDADLYLFNDARGATLFIELIDGHFLLAVRKDGFSEIKDFGELIALPDVFESAGIIFGSEE